MPWHDAPKKRHHPDVQAYLDDLDDWHRGICEAVRARLKQDAAVVEFIAWGVPSYWRNGPLVYTSAAKTHVTLGFFRGVEVFDDSGKLVGTGKSPIRKFVVKRGTELPQEFEGWVLSAFGVDEMGE